MADSSGQRPADSSVDDLDELYTAGRSQRRRFEGQWFLNLAYFIGQQWVAWDGTRIYEPALDDNRVKVVDNRIRPAVRREVAKMTKTRPVWVGVPKDQSDKEMSAARLREQVFEHDWKALDLMRKRRAALTWSRIVGAGFWKIWLDTSQGEKMSLLVGRDRQPIKDSYGKPMTADRTGQLPEGFAEQHGVTEQQFSMGDVCVEVRTPFEMVVDPLASEEGLESAEWAIEETIQSREYVRERFGHDLEPDTSASWGVAESRMPQTLGGIGVKGDENYKGIKVRELWYRPCAEYPKGKHVVWAQEKTLLEEDNAYGWLPYAMFRGQPVPGRFWPDAVVSDMISPQTELNKRKAQIAENAERIANAPLVSSASNRDVVDAWQGLPGEILYFQDSGSPNAMPQFMPVPELPAYVREDVDRIEQSMQEITGQHEVSAGTVPAGVTAASAINLLQEQDDTMLGPDIEEMEEALTNAGRRLLELRAKYTDRERLLAIAGDDSAWDIFAFKGDMLSSCEHDAVQVGSGLPQSKAAKQAALQEILNMFAQMQVPLQERDLRRVLQEYQVGGLEKFFASVGATERQIQRENLAISSGQDIEINSYDEDELHVEGHREYMRGASYQEAIARDNSTSQRMENHVQAHLNRMVQRTMTGGQVAGNAAADTGPGGPPPPPGVQSTAPGNGGPPVPAQAPAQGPPAGPQGY
jgi:hypothetical protein